MCRDAFHYRNDVRAVSLAAGTPSSLYEVHDEVSRSSKARVARAVLDDLRARGEQGHATIVRKIEELGRLNKPQRDAPDQRAGYLALEELKWQATEADILISPMRAAAEARRAKSRRDALIVEERRATLGGLRQNFLALKRATPRGVSGYSLEYTAGYG
ncbi:hypothetical protein [Micromonospora profundi]|uniref:hypothetical protein n=1 Tax=Micromonospora profundi TaxID=1420889 RepID=UPI00366A4996